MVKRIIILIVLVFTIFFTQAQEIGSVTDLPLQLLPGGKKDTMVIYLTGDGGWNNFSQNIANEFFHSGYGVVTLNTRKYFWSPITPEVFAKDFELFANYFLHQWKKSTLIIVGYSFGADVAAFLPQRLSDGLKHKIKLLVLLSPSSSTDFEVKFNDMLFSNGTSDRKFKIGPELEKSTLPMLCVFGKEEEMDLKSKLKKSEMLTIVELPGTHHYDNISSLVSLICK